jgi:DNA-binding response OmpR family regulator
MLRDVKVLVVEDDPKLSRFLMRVLAEEGYVVDTCSRGADAIEQAGTIQYDAIVLDWMLPDVDGVSVCRELRRARVATPVLMLTARGETRERVLGLEAGADDYMVKPFEVDEFVARVRALIRRASGFGRMQCGAIEIDRVAHRARLRGESLDLTAREYALLVHLVHHAEKVVTRSDLLSQVWATTFDPGSNLLEVHISRLRDKLGDDAWVIETVRGAGYRLRSQRPA